MALIRKGSTPKLAAAVRRNGRKSRGPRTAAGKRNSSLNAIKHGAFAQVDLPHMRALGEDPAQFADRLESLLSSFQPQDGYEELSVTDMAKLHWRVGRMERGEAAFLASRLQALRRDREWKAHLARRARLNAFRDYTPARKLRDILAGKADPNGVHYSGLEPEGDVNSPESPEKYASILGTLRTVRGLFLDKGFKGIRATALEIVLGHGANCLGSDLISSYQACAQDFDQQPDETRECRRQHFLDALDREIRYFEEEFQLYLGREVEVSPEMAEAELLPSTENVERIVRYETHLERLIEMKWQQLLDWRRQKANAPALSSRLDRRTGKGENG